MIIVVGGGLVLAATIDFSDDPVSVARALIGATLTINGVGGRIVETEAYDQQDPASHCFVGPTTRNAAMFGPQGHVYIYRSYGIHWCLNIVCRPQGHGAGVLIRAIEPLFSREVMQQRRGTQQEHLLCSGPGRLGQALGIHARLNGLSLAEPPFMFQASKQPMDVVVGPRIGISKAVDRPWRFGLAGSTFLSRPFPRR